MQILNAGFAILLILTYIGLFINPYYIPFIAFLGILYPYLLVINIFFVILWVTKKDMFFLLSLLTILIGFQHIGKLIQFNTGSNFPDKGDKIKVMSYNVRLFNYYEWVDSKSTRERIVKYITSESPQILCLQEFLTDKNTSVSDPDFQKKYSHLYPMTSTNNREIMLATFTSYPIIAKGKKTFRPSANGYIFSDILIGADTVRVINAHLQSIHFNRQESRIFKDWSFEFLNYESWQTIFEKLNTAYSKRAQQVDSLVDFIKNTSYPVIVCGDFNDTPFSYAYQRLSDILKDAFRNSGRGMSITYKNVLMPLRIDYIFYSSKFKSFNYRTHNIKLSDHKPISIELVLPDAIEVP